MHCARSGHCNPIARNPLASALCSAQTSSWLPLGALHQASSLAGPASCEKCTLWSASQRCGWCSFMRFQYGVQLVVALGLGEPPQCLFFGGVVTFAHGLLPSLTIASKCSLGQGTSPSQRLVCEEHTYQDRHGNDQERDGQVSQSPGPFRASACGQGSERGESEPGHGVQRIAIDDRSDSPDEPQRRGYPHEEPEALAACSSRSAHLLTPV